MQESEGVLCMRVSFRIALAGQVIGVSALYEQTRTFCKNYLTDAPASFEVAVTPADIAFEREKNDREAAVEGHAPGNFSDEYLETLALYRKIVERLLEWDTLLFHGSCMNQRMFSSTLSYSPGSQHRPSFVSSTMQRISEPDSRTPNIGFEAAIMP